MYCVRERRKALFLLSLLGPDPVFGSVTGSALLAPPRAPIRVPVSAARVRNIFFLFHSYVVSNSCSLPVMHKNFYSMLLLFLSTR
jgi:hypothetical protein